MSTEAVVFVLAEHSAECDAERKHLGWEDQRWMAEWRGPTTMKLDKRGRRHRHGATCNIWRCTLLMACPAQAAVPQRTIEAVISALIDGGSANV